MINRTHADPNPSLIDDLADVRQPWGFVFLAALVLVAAYSRVLSIAPNVSAVAATALLAGFVFRSRLAALCVPLCAMLLSDAILGWYEWKTMVVVYAALCAPVALRPLLGGRIGALRVAGVAVLGATIFFLSTNMAVWAFSGMYAKNLAGLIECYTLALPFFRNTLMGDVGFAAGLFGGLALLRYLAARRSPALAGA